MRLEDLIKKLERLHNAYGDCEVVVYKSYQQKESQILGASDVYYDADEENVSIGIYD